LLCQPFGLRLTPVGNFAVMTGQKNVWYCTALPNGRTRILRVLKQTF
jgi:hypothetical protein